MTAVTSALTVDRTSAGGRRVKERKKGKSGQGGAEGGEEATTFLYVEAVDCLFVNSLGGQEKSPSERGAVRGRNTKLPFLPRNPKVMDN